MKPLPDILEIQPLTKPPNCTITVPGSKSITNRALILAALADGKCTLRGALWADDTQVMVESLQKLGFDVKVSLDPAEECNRTIEVVGCGGEIPAKKAELYVGNAGTAARFLTAFVCLGKGEYRIDGDMRMRERPMKDLFDALRKLGVQIESSNDRLPAEIRASGLNGGDVEIRSEHSSQFASALALICKPAKLDLKVGGNLGYVGMTFAMVNEFTSDYQIEPDIASASYFLGAEFISGGEVSISDWPADDWLQEHEWRFPQHLQSLSQKANPVTVSRETELGDTVMTLAVCAVLGKCRLEIVEASRMRLQETDRIKAMVTELRKVGGEDVAEEKQDGFTVWPAEPGQLHGADIETYNDHRMAMCFAVLGLKVPGIRIKNPGCVSKTFPNFFEKLEQLRR